jgi:hypothetical protein
MVNMLHLFDAELDENQFFLDLQLNELPPSAVLIL